MEKDAGGLKEAVRHLIHKLRENYTFFSEMGDEEIAGVLKWCKNLTFEAGTEVFRQGDHAKDFYLVVSGEVAISMNGREVTRLGPGRIFGEMALLEGLPRNATAAAAERSAVFSIPATVLSARAPALAYKVLLGVAHQMSEKLRETNAHFGLS